MLLATLKRWAVPVFLLALAGCSPAKPEPYQWVDGAGTPTIAYRQEFSDGVTTFFFFDGKNGAIVSVKSYGGKDWYGKLDEAKRR